MSVGSDGALVTPNAPLLLHLLPVPISLRLAALIALSSLQTRGRYVLDVVLFLHSIGVAIIGDEKLPRYPKNLI